jgi:flagellar M-ring protein FliF
MANTTQLQATNQSSSTMTAPDRARVFWSTRTSKQRIYIGIGLAITVATVALLAQMMSTPDYKPLISGLESADVQTITSELTAKKIPFLLGPDGASITVPADQIDAARLEISSHDSPHSGRLGFEIFDKVSWGQTEFDEKVNYQRALEGELERTIQTMSNIKSARVHLVMAKDSVFMDRERSAKASVTLRLRHSSLSREELKAITQLVAGAVDELKPDDVAIVDADSNQSLNASTSGTTDDEGEKTLTQHLIATLAPIVGADHIHASVNLEYEIGSSEESQEKYDPAVSVPLNMQRTEENISNTAAVGGVPGTSSNVVAAKPVAPSTPAIATPAATPQTGQSSKTESATYGVNHTTRHTIEPAGRIRRLTAAILVDDLVEHHHDNGKLVETYRKHSPEDLELISNLAQAAIGFNSARGDVISVQNISFVRTPVDVAPPPTLVDAARANLNNYASLLRYGALFVLCGLVYLLMIRPLQKRALAAPDPLWLATHSGSRELTEDALNDNTSLLAQRTLQLKKQLSEFVQADPETSTVAVRSWLREEAK